jgi:hypothetical protein
VTGVGAADDDSGVGGGANTIGVVLVDVIDTRDEVDEESEDLFDFMLGPLDAGGVIDEIIPEDVVAGSSTSIMLFISSIIFKLTVSC